jgi:Domain of unknown function (DUF927)
LGYPSPEQQAQKALDKKKADAHPEIVRLAALLDAGQLEEFGASRESLLKEWKGVTADVFDAEIKKHRRVETPAEVDDGYGDDEDGGEDNDSYAGETEPSDDATSSPPEGVLGPSKGRFTMHRGKGLYVKTDKRPKWVCVPFYILGHGRNPFGRDWGLFIRFQDRDRQWRTRYLPYTIVAGDPGVLCASLLSDGLVIERIYFLHFASYLNRVRVISVTVLFNERAYSVSQYCVYTHSTAGRVFYVGCGTPNRPYDRHHRTPLWHAHVKEIGDKYDIIICARTGDSAEAQRIERELVVAHKPACNIKVPPVASDARTWPRGRDKAARPMRCRQCKALMVPRSRGPAPTFCSGKCRVAWFRRLRKAAPGGPRINSRRTNAERGDDAYFTPPCAVRSLMALETLPHEIMDPCCGNGAILDVLVV